MKTYQFSSDGLNQAISDRKHTLKLRKHVILLGGAIVLLSILNVPVGTVVAFTTL